MPKRRLGGVLVYHTKTVAQLVHRCFTAHRKGTLPSGAHYFVISDNTYNIFDIETPRSEVGYDPEYNAESFFGQSR